MVTSSATEDFINEFHGISGTTIGERRKNLFMILNSNKTVEVDLKKLEPNNHLEESFKVDALIYFRNFSGLIDIFKTENAALIKKVVKINWLWNYFNASIIRDLFPQISFNSKLKIINKLAVHFRNSLEADVIFGVLCERYGMYLAAKLLPCCSFTLISNHFNYNVLKHLKVRQSLSILRKYPELVGRLLQDDNTRNIFTNYKSGFKQLLQYHTEVFQKLYLENVYCYYTLGWRATNKFIHAKKATFIDNALYFSKYLHTKQIPKSIGVDFCQFFVKMFPKDYLEFKSRKNVYLNLLKTRNIPNKFELFSSTFETMYGINVLDSDTLDQHILELIHNKQWLLVTPRFTLPRIVAICFKKTKESIPILQKYISFSSDTKTRAELVGSLVETCRINKDKEALLEVCKYVYQEHRNDDSSVLLCFFNVLETGFSFDELTEEHWSYLGKIVKIFMARDLVWFHYLEYISAYAFFLFKNNKPLKPIVGMLAKQSMELGGYNRSAKLNPEFEKQYLIILGEILPELYKENEINSQYVTYLTCLIKWNKKHPQDKFALLDNENAVKALIEEWQSDHSHCSGLVISHILCSKIDCDKSFWMQMYFKKKTYCEMAHIEWLIKYEPILVSQHIQLIIDLILDMYYTQVHRFFFTMSKNYSHLDLPQKIKNICLNVVNSKEESDSRKKNALAGLSYVLTDPQEYITLITPYYPVDKTEPEASVYVLQQSMTRSLGNIIPPSSILKSVLLFSKGDYTKFIQRSLYFVAFSVTEDKLEQFFSELNGLAVSVRKHAIYLGFRVLDRKSVYKIVARNVPDKNVSIRKFLLRSIFNFFTGNPDDFVWDMLKESIRNVDTDDKEAMDVLVQFQKVPVNYMASYIAFIVNSVVFNNEIANLIPDSVFSQIDRDLIVNIVDSNKCGTVFIYKWLTNSDKLELQVQILELALTKCDLNMPVFLKDCAAYFITKKYNNTKLLQKCIEQLNKLQPRYKYVEDCLYLQLCKIYLEYYVNHKSITTFAKNLVNMYETYITTYKVVLNKLCNVLSTFITPYFNDNLFELIQSIVENSQSEYAMAMAISLLPRELPQAPKKKLVFNKIIEVLHLNQHPMVVMSLSLYLNEVTPHYAVEERTQFESDGNKCFYWAHQSHTSAYASADFLLL